MSGIYSTRFCAAAGLNGSLAYTVPEGNVAVLRDVDVYAAGVDGGFFRVIGSAGQTIDYWEFGGEDTAATHQWRGREVLSPGETLTFSTTSPMDVTASGYLLVV
jgi:hypothetical protein